VPKDPIVAVSVATAICFVCEAIDSLREGGAEIEARSIQLSIVAIVRSLCLGDEEVIGAER